MKSRNRKIERIRGWFSAPWYFLVFSVYPVLALLSVNVGQVKLEAGWRPLLVSALAAGLLFRLLRLPFPFSGRTGRGPGPESGHDL
jgi:hypothetical protein